MQGRQNHTLTKHKILNVVFTTTLPEGGRPSSLLRRLRISPEFCRMLSTPGCVGNGAVLNCNNGPQNATQF